jgi:hypothetical protein
MHLFESMLIAVCDCVRCALCCVRCVAFKFMQFVAVYGKAHCCVAVYGSVWQCVRQCVRLSGYARGNVRLSNGAAVCDRLAVCIFSNKFETYLNKSV